MALIWGILIVAVVYLYTHDLFWMAWYNRKAKKAGCGHLPLQRYRPFGISFAMKALKWVREHVLLEKMSGQLEAHHRSTILVQRPFTYSVLTIDPENIKVVLATQFKDFSLGIREQIFAPAFGSGIFTLNGQGWKHSRQMLRP